MWWEHLIYSLSNFQVHDTSWLTIITMLGISSPERTHHITGSLYPLTSTSLFPSSPQPLKKKFKFLYLWVQLFKILHIHDSILHLSLSFWLTLLRIVPSSSIKVIANGRNSLRLNNISWCVCVWCEYTCMFVCVYHIFFIHSNIGYCE